MKNVERLKIHNEGMKIHKISIENTFSYCILVSLGAPPAVVPQTHGFILALGWGGELEWEHHASLSGVGGPGWGAGMAAPCSPGPGLV